MKFLLYEFLTGGGLAGQELSSLPASLLREGTAMVSSLAADLAAIPGAEVTVLRDARRTDLAFPGCQSLDVGDSQSETVGLVRQAANSDWTVLIAPEFNGYLANRCRLVETAGGRLLGPGSHLVELTGDKQATCELLQVWQVPVPQGWLLDPGQPLPASCDFPAVLKARWGAGSQEMRLLRDPASLRDAIDASRCWWPGFPPAAASDGPQALSTCRVERYCPGVAASVAWLCGPQARIPLVPCRQLLSGDGRFTYLGGSLPLPAGLAARAVDLSRRAIESLPNPLGYLGIDLVLGAAPDRSEDYVIEINPRLTTSYVGLRAAVCGNLAGAMLDIAEGRSARPSFDPTPLRFTADGTVSREIAVP